MCKITAGKKIGLNNELSGNSKKLARLSGGIRVMAPCAYKDITRQEVNARIIIPRKERFGREFSRCRFFLFMIRIVLEDHP
jgi:hypothetical protein